MAPTSTSVEAIAQDEVVLLIHGIRTHAAWAEMVAHLIESKLGMSVIVVKYGFFDAVRFLCPFFTRATPVRRVVREYRDARIRYPNAKISIIAHSFGTYTIARALEEPDFVVHRTIFCGSIVEADFRVASFRAQLGPDPVLNDCGTHDIWPVIAQSVTWGYSATGTFGFGTTGVHDRFSKFSHSDYFDAEFVEAYWLPFLANGTIVGTEWEVKRSTPPYWQSLLSSLPLRWLPILALAAALIWVSRDFLSARSVTVTAANQIYIGHWIGVSNVQLKLAIDNMSSSSTQIFVPSIVLTAPSDGRTTQLGLEAIINCDGSVPQTFYITVDAHRSTTCAYSFIGFVNSQTSQVSMQLNQLSLTKGPQPLPTDNLIDGQLLQTLKDTATNNFAWTVGTWKLSINYQLLAIQKTDDYLFTVSEEDVQKLKSLFDGYGAGYGVFYNWRYLTPDGSQPMRQISLSKASGHN